jgi:selenocysteine-specific elongation factor
VRRLILGTAGHIDHGKTSLVRALTGIDTDRLPEEKRRGITIDLGFARLEIDDQVEYGIVDVPGHEAFIRNMLAGATGIDVALLVVAADEGVMPQTREHVSIIELLGIQSLVVALTKCDLVEADWRELVEDEVRALLDEGRFAGSPVVAVSSRSGVGLDGIRAALADAAGRTLERSDADLFRLPVDRVFTVRGTGTVVTGTVWSGSIERDRSLRALPADLNVRVRTLHTHGTEQSRVRAGQRAALGLVGIDRDDIERGAVLVEGAGWTPASILTVRVTTLTDHPPIRTGQRIRFHLGTVELLGRIVPFDPGPIDPGSSTWAQIRLEAPVVARAGDRFVLRSCSPVSTIAGGQIAEPIAQKRKRPPADTRARLESLIDGSVDTAAGALALLNGWAGVALDQVPIRLPAPAARASEAFADRDDVVVIGSIACHRSILEDAAHLLLEALDNHHLDQPLSDGFPREQLRQVVPAVIPGLADRAIQHLVEHGHVELGGSIVRRSGHEPVLDADQKAVADQLTRLYAEAGLASPSLTELPPSLSNRSDLESVVRHLQRTGTFVPLAPGKPIDRASIEAAVQRVAERFGGREAVSPAEFRELLGLSRKYLIPVLEYLDRIGLTARVGESRRVGGVGSGVRRDRLGARETSS